MTWANQSSIPIHLLGAKSSFHRASVARKNADGASKVLHVIWFPLQDALSRFVVPPFAGPWTTFDNPEKEMGMTATFSLYGSGSKEQAKESVRSSARTQNVAALGEAACAVIDALPGDGVTLSFSGATYNTEGKDGSSGSLSITTHTMDKRPLEDRVDG